MAIVQAPPLIRSRPSAPGGRDAVIDLVRAVCVTGVVLLHSIMVGVTVTDAGPVFANASDGTWWIIPVSWMLQVMPLFFVIGGFAGLHALRRLRSRGGTAAEFVAGRVQRLLRPALVTIAVVGATLAALAVGGVDPALIGIAGFRFSQPLWFLAVFLLCQALLPVLAAAHERMPLRTLGLLAAAAVVVDALRAGTGVEGIGFLNLAFVWLAMQQVGFFLADGTIDRLPRTVRIAGGAAALAALVAAFAGGIYSPDLIANINPPTGALMLVGLVHLSALSLLREPLARFGRRPRVDAFTRFVNARAMTVYLWHMPVLLAMAGASAIVAISTGVMLPEPSTLLWWLGRPFWLAAALVLSAIVAVALTRFETGSAPGAPRSVRRVAAAALIGIVAVLLLLVAGTTVLTAAVATAGIAVSLRLARRSHQAAGGERVADVVRMPQRAHEQRHD
ncbi:acyltransferase [Microbacterium sp. SD291]|uniref:acyltransferase family protein n=1 Tax=Microbacterium sp. SD291 TaxID=2782007 RepID=UPI001A95978A|nr:acyltransferase [Microbacterium sp. SD291]MBO0979203.1 acyltransferase [Microbacterium sp. SD291]